LLVGVTDESETFALPALVPGHFGGDDGAKPCEEVPQYLIVDFFFKIFDVQVVFRPNNNITTKEV